MTGDEVGSLANVEEDEDEVDDPWQYLAALGEWANQHKCTSSLDCGKNSEECLWAETTLKMMNATTDLPL